MTRRLLPAKLWEKRWLKSCAAQITDLYNCIRTPGALRRASACDLQKIGIQTAADLKLSCILIQCVNKAVQFLRRVDIFVKFIVQFKLYVYRQG